MDRKAATQFILQKSRERQRSAGQKKGNRDGPKTRQDMQEDMLLEHIENKDVSREFVQTLQKVMKNQRSVKDAFDQAAIPAILELMVQMRGSNSEKTRREAALEFLDRAGHGKVTKVHNLNENLGPNASEAELISQITGLLIGNRLTSPDKIKDGEFEDVE